MIKKLGDNRKGVSPVIATVLLIGMVVIIALIVFFWFRGLTQEAVTKFDKNAELVCDEVFFEASYSNGNLGISNTGNVPIYNMKVKKVTGGDFTTEDLSDLSESWPEYGIPQGGAFSDSVGSGGAEIIVLTPVLLGSGQSGGEREFSCNELRYGYEIVL